MTIIGLGNVVERIRRMRQVRVAILGRGAVGIRLAQTLVERFNELGSRFDVKIALVAMCSSRKGISRQTGLTSSDIDDLDLWEPFDQGVQWLQEVVSAPDVLFECGPSDFDRHPEPSSLPFYRLVLGEGKTVIVMSKSALVSHGPELKKLARERSGWVGLSAATGAALPGLDLLRNSVNMASV